MQVLQIEFTDSDRKSDAEHLFGAILNKSLSSRVGQTPRPHLRSDDPAAGQTSSLDEVELALDPESRQGPILRNSISAENILRGIFFVFE
jgi:hypothetical protein